MIDVDETLYGWYFIDEVDRVVPLHTSQAGLWI